MKNSKKKSFHAPAQMSAVSFFIAVVSKPSAEMCNSKVPVKTRVVISWCGDCGENEFVESVASTRVNLARDADLLIEAIGPTVKNISASSRAKKTVSVPASAQGLDDISLIIKRKFEEFKQSNPKADPQSFEIDFIATNHGTVFVDEKRKPVSYGISGDPSLRSSPDLFDLKSFGASLPKGARLKTVFAQCYGADSANAIREGFEKNSEANCSCNSSLADLRRPAFDQPAFKTSFEKAVSDFSGERSASLAQAHWAAMQKTPLAPAKKSYASNGANLGSEQVALDFFKVTPSTRVSFAAELLRRHKFSPGEARIALKTGDLEIWEKSKAERRKAMAYILGVDPGSKEFEASMRRIEKSKIQPAEALPDVLETLEKIIARASRELKKISFRENGIWKEIQELKSRSLQLGSFDPRTIKIHHQISKKYDDLRLIYKENKKVSANELKQMNELGNELGNRDSGLNKRASVATLLARQEMEEQFLLSAPAALKQKFFAARACELEKFGPGPAQYQDETSSGAHAEK